MVRNNEVDVPEEIGFFLAPRFSSMAFFCAVEPLRVANRLAGRDLYRWRILSADGEPVESSNGMRLVADAALDAATAPATVIICSGFDPTKAATKSLLAILRRLSARRCALGALDTGAHILALAGVTRGSHVVLHWEAQSAFEEAFPETPVSSELFEDDGLVFTCAGGTAALDLMLHRIGRAHGLALATAVSEQFIHDRIRSKGDHQRMPPARRLNIANEKVLAAISLMEAALERPLPARTLAMRAGVTPRQLERLFQDALGVSPMRYYKTLRLTRARELLRQTDLPVLEVAIATGFSSTVVFSRGFREQFARSPRDDRRDE